MFVLLMSLCLFFFFVGVVMSRSCAGVGSAAIEASLLIGCSWWSSLVHESEPSSLTVSCWL